MPVLRRYFLFGLGSFSAVAALPAWAQDDRAAQTQALKAQILDLARQIMAAGNGTGPAITALRLQIDDKARQMVVLNPQAPLKDRLPQLVGTWYTALSPTDQPGADKKNPYVDTHHVYQVISKNGYYYNVLPLIDRQHPERSRMGLLRGAYSFSTRDPTALNIHYTRFYGCEHCLADPAPWRFAALEEAGKLPNRINIVPDILLGVFLPDDQVLEIYSDEDMRLAYGTKDKQTGKRTLYVMTRVTI